MKKRFKFIFLLFLCSLTLCLSSCLIMKKPEEVLPQEFTEKEQNQMLDHFGFTLPFIKDHKYSFYNYYIKDYSMEYSISKLTLNEFLSYNELFNSYEFIGKKDNGIDISYHYYDKERYAHMDLCFQKKLLSQYGKLDVYLYHRGDISLYDSYYTNKDYPISNLSNTISLNNAAYQTLKDITGYKYRCPAKGNVKILVIPLEFKDKPHKDSLISIAEIKRALNKTYTTDPYPSLKDYYQASSYGNLMLDFEVVNGWYQAKKLSINYNSFDSINQLLLDALEYYDNLYNYKDFDSDNDNAIDGIMFIHTLESSELTGFSWPATRVTFKDIDGNREKFDGVFPYSYNHINYDQIVNARHDMVSSYTLIHEFGHILGLDDYYDSNYTKHAYSTPLSGYDVMDMEFCDQNIYSKMLLGWVDLGHVINESNTTITLNSFEQTGDYAIIGNSFDETHGPFQEFYIIIYNSGSLINSFSNVFKRKGILIYHVNGALYTYSDGLTYLAFNNDQAGVYANRYNLIEYVDNDIPFSILVDDKKEKDFHFIDDNDIPLDFKLSVNQANSDSLELNISYI